MTVAKSIGRVMPFASGLLFGAGLAISGMTSPARVRAFLDITGAWDPTLAFVMGGALAVATPLFAWGRCHPGTLDGHTLPTHLSKRINAKLIGGAALFGMGWGLAGLCPGPALVDLMIQPLAALTFVFPLALGMLLSRKD